MPVKVTLNRKQKLYVLDHGQGYTCLGFDVLVQRLNKLQAWLNTYENIGKPSISLYRLYERTMEAARLKCEAEKIRCPLELEPQLIGLEGHRVEVVDQWDQKKRFYVGKSTGWMPCHLEIARCDSTGGPATMGPYKSVTDLGKRRY